LVLIYDIWKCTPILSNGVNFVKDYQKDSYNKRIFNDKNVNDKNILTTLKKHSYFFKCEILKFKNSNNVSKLLQDFRTSRVFYHI